MKTSRQLKLAQRVATQQQETILELQAIAKDIERCETSIITLTHELEKVNATHASRQTTQDDVNYLEDLLRCARKKLVWEKQMQSIQKRIPALMEKVQAVVNHPESNPDEQTRTSLVESLNNVKAAMERLQQAKS